MMLLTGYPSWMQKEPYYCEECGVYLEEDEVYEDDFHECLCEDCLLDLHQKF